MRGVGARAFVLGELGDDRFDFAVLAGNRAGDVEGDDLVFEGSVGLRLERLAVRVIGELVHLFTRDAVMLGHVLSGEAHGEIAARIVLDQPWVDGDLVAAEGNERHRFGAAGDEHVARACLDAVGGDGDALQAGRAVAVDRHAADVVRQASAEGGYLGDVHALLGLGSGAADNDVLDLAFIQLRNTCERAGNGGGSHVVGACGAERAARGFADCGADCGCDDDFIHNW